MLSLALCLLLSDVSAPTPAPGAVEPPAVPTFDALPEPPRIADDGRVQRFLGALAGGAVGLGAMLAPMPLFDDPASCGGFGSCGNGGHALMLGLAPLVSVVGAWLGWMLGGGTSTPLVAAVAIPLAGLLTLALLGVTANGQRDTLVPTLPVLIAGGAALVGSAALAMDARQQQLAGLGNAGGWASASAGRLALTSLVSLLTIGASAAATALSSIGLFFGSGVGLVMPFVVGGALSLASAATVFAVHRALGGQGTFRSALLGMGLAVTAAGGALGLFFASTPAGLTGFGPRDGTALISMISVMSIAALLVPALALEWSHTETVKRRLPSMSFGAAPLREGGMVSAAMRF